MKSDHKKRKRPAPWRGALPYPSAAGIPLSSAAQEASPGGGVFCQAGAESAGRPGPRFFPLGASSPAPPGPLFAAKKRPEKPPECGWSASHFDLFYATARLCLSYRGCMPVTTAVMVLLPDRLALSSYPSFGLEACSLIHMKYGYETQWAPLFTFCFLIEADRFIYPIHRASAEVSIDTHHRSEPRRI